MAAIPLLAGSFQGGGAPLMLLAKAIGIVLLVPIMPKWVVPRIFFSIAKTRSRELFPITTSALFKRCCLG